MCGLLLKEALLSVSTISCLVENLTLTVSEGFSSVYNLLPDPLGFLPVPTLGSFPSAYPNFRSEERRVGKGCRSRW